MTEWISVKDRLPEFHEDKYSEWGASRAVIGTDGRNIFMAYAGKNFRTGKCEWHTYGWIKGKTYAVSHWMPLPAPPEVDPRPANK